MNSAGLGFRKSPIGLQLRTKCPYRPAANDTLKHCRGNSRMPLALCLNPFRKAATAAKTCACILASRYKITQLCKQLGLDCIRHSGPAKAAHFLHKVIRLGVLSRLLSGCVCICRNHVRLLAQAQTQCLHGLLPDLAYAL